MIKSVLLVGSSLCAEHPASDIIFQHHFIRDRISGSSVCVGGRSWEKTVWEHVLELFYPALFCPESLEKVCGEPVESERGTCA